VKAQRVGTGKAVENGTAEIVFIIDRTGSMGGPINNVIDNLNVFTESLTGNNIDVRYGIVTYSDIHVTEIDPPIMKYDFTDNVEQFRNQLMGGSTRSVPVLHNITPMFPRTPGQPDLIPCEDS
jgi:hypothetical protein